MHTSGVQDMHTKTEKKYNSKAAKGYKAFLTDAVASANPSSVVGESVVVDDSATLVAETSSVPTADDKSSLAPGFTDLIVSGSSAPASTAPAKPKLKLASSLSGAGKLQVPTKSKLITLGGVSGGGENSGEERIA